MIDNENENKSIISSYFGMGVSRFQFQDYHWMAL